MAAKIKVRDKIDNLICSLEVIAYLRLVVFCSVGQVYDHRDCRLLRQKHLGGEPEELQQSDKWRVGAALLPRRFIEIAEISAPDNGDARSKARDGKN